MKVVKIVLIAFLILVLQVHGIRGSRLLHEGTKLANQGLKLQALQKGPVPPSGGSSCTNIPGNGGSPCPLSEMHYALPRPATSYPRLMVQFGVATAQI